MGYERSHHLARQAGARGIDHKVGPRKAGEETGQNPGRIPSNRLIRHPGTACIKGCRPDRVRIDLHRENRPSLSGTEESRGTDTTIEIDDCSP